MVYDDFGGNHFYAIAVRFDGDAATLALREGTCWPIWCWRPSRRRSIAREPAGKNACFLGGVMYLKGGGT